jgi:tetratricopeptide (TPR) repeat protein
MLDPRDGEARFLYAKSLEKSGATAEMATAADNEARRYLPTYAKVQTVWQKSGVITEVPVRLNQQFDVAAALKSQTPLPALDTTASVTTQELLVKARADYTAGRDDNVLSELNRVLMIEPMNAEAHLLVGRIYQRRGDLQRAISSLKTSIFWEAKLIDAHILLGRIFLERGDLAQAKTYARTAIGLDPNNQEAVALYRQLETGAR